MFILSVNILFEVDAHVYNVYDAVLYTVCLCGNLYVSIERQKNKERERQRETSLCMYVYMYVYIYIYINTHILIYQLTYERNNK